MEVKRAGSLKHADRTRVHWSKVLTKEAEKKIGLFEKRLVEKEKECWCFSERKKNINNNQNEYLNVLFGQSLRFGLWTPKAVMKTLTTTIIKTRPVVRFSMRFSLWCFCTSFRFHRTVEKNKELNPTSHKHSHTRSEEVKHQRPQLWESSQNINHRCTVESTISQFIGNSQSRVSVSVVPLKCNSISSFCQSHLRITK